MGTSRTTRRTRRQTGCRLNLSLDFSRFSEAELNNLRTASPWLPKPGAQAVAWLSEADELFFGGKAGAGKSDLLIGLGITAHRKTLFLRREATQLQEISSRVKELLRPGDRWRGSGYGGLLTTGDGRTIEFAGCKDEVDKQKYKGRAHDLKAWDEVVDFPESVYLFINGWNRTTDTHQRCRIVAASNPPTTAEGEWVIRRWRAWLDPSAGNRAAPNELRWYTTIGEKEEEFPNATPVQFKGRTYYPRSRTFIPGEMLDILVATGYQNTLATLPEPLRSIYLEGDFGASKQDDRWQLIPTRWVVEAQKRWVERKAKGFGPVTALGVDPARGGEDKAALSARCNLTISELKRKPGREVPDGQSVIAMWLPYGNVPVNVDVIGIGASAVDVAKAMGLHNVNQIIVSNAANWTDPRHPQLRFTNLRSAMMWRVRSLLDPEGGPPDTRLALPPDPELLADLTAPRYELRVSGVAVESKEDIRERIGRSPDVGDAVALACWERAGGGWAVGSEGKVLGSG